jgi:hypothetical protein
LVEEDSVDSKPIPFLIAALVCDTAVSDPSTGKKSLIGIFDRINAIKFPVKRRMSLYLKVTDAEGDYDTEVRYTQMSTGKVLAQARGKLRAPDKRASLDLLIKFPPLLIPKEGRYEFQLWANSVFLGTTSIDAVQQSQR